MLLNQQPRVRILFGTAHCLTIEKTRVVFQEFCLESGLHLNPQKLSFKLMMVCQIYMSLIGSRVSKVELWPTDHGFDSFLTSHKERKDQLFNAKILT